MIAEAKNKKKKATKKEEPKPAAKGGSAKVKTAATKETAAKVTPEKKGKGPKSEIGQALFKYFGVDKFKGQQEEVIATLHAIMFGMVAILLGEVSA